MSKQPQWELYDEMLIVTSASEEPRLYFRIDSRTFKQTNVESLSEVVPGDLEQFKSFYSLLKD